MGFSSMYMLYCLGNFQDDRGGVVSICHIMMGIVYRELSRADLLVLACLERVFDMVLIVLQNVVLHMLSLSLYFHVPLLCCRGVMDVLRET